MDSVSLHFSSASAEKKQSSESFSRQYESRHFRWSPNFVFKSGSHSGIKFSQ